MKRNTLLRLFSSAASALLRRSRQFLALSRTVPRQVRAALAETRVRWPNLPLAWREQARGIENRPQRMIPRHPDAELAELIAWHAANGTLGQLFAEYPDLHS